MSPMCWLSHAYFPSATAKVFFRSAADGQRSAAPRPAAPPAAARSRGSAGWAVRSPSTTRTTESSHGTRIVPVVHQPSVGEMRKPFQRIVVGEADRFAAEVARRHHQDRRARLVARQPEQQRVQRRVGQHHAEVGIVWRDRVGDRGVPACAASARSAVACRTAVAPSASSTSRCRARSSRSGTITANGLSPRRFRRAQLGDRVLVGRVAGEVVSADALDGENAAVAQQRSGLEQPASPRVMRRRGSGSAASARSSGSRPAARGSGGRRDRRIRGRSRRTSRSAAIVVAARS